MAGRESLSQRIRESFWIKLCKVFVARECMRIISIVSSFSIRPSPIVRGACECWSAPYQFHVAISDSKCASKHFLSDWYMNDAHKNKNHHNSPEGSERAGWGSDRNNPVANEPRHFHFSVPFRVIKIDLFVRPKRRGHAGPFLIRMRKLNCNLRRARCPRRLRHTQNAAYFFFRCAFVRRWQCVVAGGARTQPERHSWPF